MRPPRGLRRVEQVLPLMAGAGAAQLATQALHWAEHVFERVPGGYVGSDDVDFSEPGVQLHLDVACECGGRVVSEGSPADLGQLARDLPNDGAAPRARQQAERSEPGAIDPELLLDYPWLAEHMAEGEPGGDRVAPGNGAGGNRAHLGQAALALDDVALDTVWRELDARRAEWHQHASGLEGDNFVTAIRGGKWTATYRGSAADCVAGSARGPLAGEWCTMFGCNRMASFAYSKYGRPSCERPRA